MFKHQNVVEIRAFLQAFKRTIEENRCILVPRKKNLELLRTV